MRQVSQRLDGNGHVRFATNSALRRNKKVPYSMTSSAGDLPASQLVRQLRQSIRLLLRPTVFDRRVLTLDEACLF